MIRIVKIERLHRPLKTAPGDSFRLWINDVEVHRAEITSVGTITHWALIEVGDSGLAYVIGNDSLPDDLQRMAG